MNKDKVSTTLKVASDIMTKKPDVIHSSQTINEVAQFFLNNKYASAPVLGNTGELLGVIDEFTLIKIKLLIQSEGEGREHIAFYSEHLLAPHYIQENTPLVEVVKEMMRAPNHRLLVTNNAKIFVGVISPKDVLRYVVGEKQKSVDLKAELIRTKTNLEKALKELEATKSKLDIYKDIVMDSPTMIHSVNEQGKILMANKKMHAILGYENNELIGMSMFDIYPDTMHGDAVTGLKRIMRDGHHKNTFSTMIKKSGEKIRVDIASTALHDENCLFLGTISVSRPVDADILLRALHGAFSKDGKGDDRYGLLDDIEEEIRKKY